MVSDGQLSRLDATFTTWARERDLSGAVLVTQAGSTVFEGCYGPAFLTRLTDGSLLGELQDTVLAAQVNAGDGYSFGYAVWIYPDGRIGHGGGDPGVETFAHRWQDDDLNLVVLCNGEGCAGDVRDAVLAACRP